MCKDERIKPEVNSHNVLL